MGAHGVKGAVKVLSYAESPSVFNSGGLICLTNPQGKEITCEIRWARPHKRIVLMSLEGSNSRSEAKLLVGSEFFIEKAGLPELEQGSYYWSDIIGLSVFTTDEKYIGRLESVIPTGSNDVYVVKGENHEILIPALESVVIAVDLENRIMQVEPVISEQLSDINKG